MNGGQTTKMVAWASFDYRIVANRLGYEGLRLNEVDFQQEGDELPDDSASDAGPGTDEAPIPGESVPATGCVPIGTTRALGVHVAPRAL